MATIEQVKQQLAALPHHKQIDAKKEINELPNILQQDEVIENAVRCFYNSGKALAVATNKRLVLVDKGLFSLKIEDFSYDKISSVEYEGGLINRKVKIAASGKKVEFDFVEKAMATMFSDFVRRKINEPKQSHVAPVSIADELKKLKELLDLGVITQDEFDAQKKKVLNN
jgi:hypothetical protein